MARILEGRHSHHFVERRYALVNLQQTIRCKEVHACVHAGFSNLRRVSSRLDQTSATIIHDKKFKQSDSTAISRATTLLASDRAIDSSEIGQLKPLIIEQ